MSEEKEFVYRIPEDDEKEARIVFAEMVAHYNDEHPNEMIVLFDERSPFKFGQIIRDKDGKAKPVRLTREELEDALYKAGLFTLRVASEKARQMFRTVLSSAENGEVRGIDIHQVDSIENLSTQEKEEWIVITVLCVVSLMCLGYLYMLRQYANTKNQGVSIDVHE